MESRKIIVNRQIYYRLIALWVVCEALLGGIIHGFKLPISGLIVGSSAVICISLIAFYVPEKGAILKATIIVAIFKMMLSPHSPLPAYFAVFFQGLIAEILFFNRKNYKNACVVFGIMALLESGVQRILLMTILYGKGFWNAVDEFINGFTKQSANYSLYLICSYLLFHFLMGALAGWFARGLPKKIEAWSLQKQNLIVGNEAEFNLKNNLQPKKKIKFILLVVWLVLIALLLQSYFSIGKPLLSAHVSFQILARSVIILLTWYFLITPLLTKFLKNWLTKKQQHSQYAINEIIQLLPSTKYIVFKSWQLSSSYKGFKKFSHFCKLVLTNTFEHA